MITKKQITKRVWVLDDNGETSSFIILGSEKALMIDSMYGREDVKKVAESVTDLPLILVNSHVHPDHVAGNRFFDKVYLNPADIPFLKMFTEEKYWNEMPQTVEVREGDVFDLGDVAVEVYELPGHTPGELCFFLPDEKILFTGDGINHHLWLQLIGCVPLEEYLQTLYKIEPLVKRTEFILHQHSTALESTRVYYDLRNGIKALVEQKNMEITNSDPDYEYFGGIVKQHAFDEEGSVICYQSDNIWKKSLFGFLRRKLFSSSFFHS